MSTVTRIDCVYCTPSAGDLHGIRRPIAGGITSEELAKLITHILTEHTKGDHHGGLQSSLNRTASGVVVLPPSVSSVETVKALVGDDSPSHGAIQTNAFGTIAPSGSVEGN